MGAPDTRKLTDVLGIGVLTRTFNRDLVDEILQSTGHKEKRSRLLPARVMVYYVLALALFYSEGYEEVMRRLIGGLQSLRSWRGEWAVPSTSAISQARRRLGEEPLHELFRRVAVPLAKPGSRGSWYRKWRVMAIDGVQIDVPDTPENRAEFGKNGNHLSASPFPQVRIVGLAECGTHAIVAAAMGPRTKYERELARELLPSVQQGMFVLADRGFYGYDLWRKFADTGAEMLWRVGSNLEVPPLTDLPDGSYLSILAPAKMKAQLKRGKLRRIQPQYEVPVRVIEYQVENREGKEEYIRLLTTVTDHEAAPANELAALYQERWEYEIGLDEIETHQMGRPRVLRSKSPEMVRQELWAFLLTHYAIRSFMAEAADDIDGDPDRLSYMRSLRVIRRQVTSQAGFSPSNSESGSHGNSAGDN